MTKKPDRCALISLGLLAFVLCCSCSARIEARVQNDGGAEVQFEAALEPQVTGLLRKMSESFGFPFAIDGESMRRSIASAPGVSAVKIYNKSPAALAGSFSVPKINEFLSQAGTGGQAGAGKASGAGRFISYSQDSRGGNLAISIDLEQAPGLLANFSEDIIYYLGAVMAPVESGIPQSREEYLEGVSSIYGPALAQEIARARIRLIITVPGTIKRIQGGTSSGNRGDFDIPLIDFLVLDRPLFYEIAW